MSKGIEKYFGPFLDRFSAILAQNKHILESHAKLRPVFSLARSFSFMFHKLYLNIVLNTHITYIMNLKKVIYLSKSTFLYHRKAYGASPTDSGKSDFFHILAEKICFWIFLGFTKLNIDKAI